MRYVCHEAQKISKNGMQHKDNGIRCFSAGMIASDMLPPPSSLMLATPRSTAKMIVILTTITTVA